MPTPVSAARLCLAPEAAAALDEAVAVARRRCHAQTTSLHVVSALLSLPSSSSSLLRDALSRARSAAYSPRLQFKALELCFSVALDRLPSSSTAAAPNNSPSSSTVTNTNNNSNSGDGACTNAPSTTTGLLQQDLCEPPVSNSLMAAIKRSQANQRRNPEAFHLYQHQQATNPQSPSFAGVKVELQQLVLSILDDPVVSRVFGEAGFRSCDIKLAVLRPPPPSVLRFPRSGAGPGARCPPLFLCNFSSPVAAAAEELDPLRPAAFSFPFSRHLLYSDGSEENSRRIGELLARGKGRNPLLVGTGAAEAAREFLGTVARQNWAALPLELTGLTFFSIEKDVADFAGSCGLRDRSCLESKLRSLESVLTDEEGRFRSGPGILVSFGDLKAFVDNEDDAREVDPELAAACDDKGQTGLRYVVAELTRLVTGPHSRRLWLMGSSSSYEIYMKFLAKYPSLDKDWDLQLLPITAAKFAAPASFPRPTSFMESFVPLGGFFPVASSTVTPTSRIYQSALPCNQCDGKFEKEVATVVKERSVPSLNMNKANLPSWLSDAAPVGLQSLDIPKAKDDRTVFIENATDLRRNWNDASLHLNHVSHILEADKLCSRTEVFPRIIGFSLVAGNQVLNQTSHSSNTKSGHILSPASTLDISLTNKNFSLPAITEPSNNKDSSQDVGLYNKPKTQGSQSRSSSHSDLGAVEDQASPSSVASVSTDLMLGNVPISCPTDGKPTVLEPLNPEIRLRCSPFPRADATDENMSVPPGQSSSYHSCTVSSKSSWNSGVTPQTFQYISSAPSPLAPASQYPTDTALPYDFRDLKLLYRSLIEKVGRQEEAIYEICETIVRCKTGKGHHQGIWLSFLGPDTIGKKKVAMALAGLLFGSKGKFLYFDLGSQQGCSNTNKVCDEQAIGGSDTNFRGKTVVDFIAGEIHRNPWSVVFIENIDKADLLVQRSLRQAISTGRFSDSQNKEISISNSVIVTTARDVKDKVDPVWNDRLNFSEDRILAAKRWQMKIQIDSVLKPLNIGPHSCLSPNSWRQSRTELNSSCFVYVNKRKLPNVDNCKDEFQPVETIKRAHKSFNALFDLNVPFEETAEVDSENSSDESSIVSENAETWLESFCEAVHKTVVFKPFDFDALGGCILKEINKCFLDTIGSKCLLEIDPKAMEQIIAATWLLGGVENFNNWLQQVLARCFMEARERYNLSAQTTLRLVACEDEIMKEQAQGIRLPSSIVVV